MTVVLDTGPLGLLTQRRGVPQADECRAWLDGLLARGVDVAIPEIADYELRRELIRLGQTSGLERLDRLKALLEYLPINTEAMLQAAEYWAEARQHGRPTADKHALDGDAILAAQAKMLRAPETIIATTNVGHLSRFVPAKEWRQVL